MVDETRVRIVQDDYGIYSADGFRVKDTETEHQAFTLIEGALRHRASDTKATPLIIVLGKYCKQHFGTYRSMRHVVVDTLTPRSELASILGSDLPDWLHDDDIVRWQLLKIPAPEDGPQSWPDRLAEWLIPGVVTAANLSDLFRAIIDTEDSHEAFTRAPMREYLIQRFYEVSVTLPESCREALKQRLVRADRPDTEMRMWILHTWRLPVTMKGPTVNPLFDHAASQDAVRFAEIARNLPLIFPLPTSGARQVTPHIAEAIARAHLSDTRNLTKVALRLTFISRDIAKEIAGWIEAHPRELSSDASNHLTNLPGFQEQARLKSVIDECAPVPMTDTWTGLDETFTVWVRSYAKYSRTAFYRREFSQWELDPAYSFARWLKAHHEVIYTHPECSYARVASTVRLWLSRGRPVLLILVDALAIHLVDQLALAISDEIEETASKSTYLFTPAPTTTEQCKKAVLTGKPPNQTRGDLQTQLCEAYSLKPSEVLFTAHWKEAELKSPVAATKLLLYVDNRLDQLLNVASQYRDLVDNASTVFRDIAQISYKWIRDLRILHSNDPVVLVTADHGFTYGPPPKIDHLGDQQRRGAKRCVRVGADTAKQTLPESSYTILTPSDFRLDSPYVAVRDRAGAHEVSDRWELSHGGLLPEEIIIPLIEWFTTKQGRVWPELTLPGPALKREKGWTIIVRLTNPSQSRIVGGTLSARTRLSQPLQTVEYPSLDPGEDCSLELQFRLPDTLSDESGFDVEFEMVLPNAKGDLPSTRLETRRVRCDHPLVQRTRDQEAFEAMF